MKIAVIHDGPAYHALILTSLIHGLKRQYGEDCEITWMSHKDNEVFFKHNEGVRFIDIDHAMHNLLAYDIMICYGGSLSALRLATMVHGFKKLGYYLSGNDVASYNEVAEEAKTVLYGNRGTEQNIFQVFFSIAGLTWRGEGYCFTYYPKTKTRKNTVGLAIKDCNIRDGIRNNLGDLKLWKVPFKVNILKQFNEINLCQNIITDDEFVMHAALALRKHVELLVYRNPNMRQEFFGNGATHIVPDTAKGSRK